LKDLKEEDFSWLAAGDQRAFEAFFRKQYRPLVAHALKFLRDPDEAEEVVQDVFVKLWEKRGEITAQTSLSAYLYTSVRNQC
jgi:RNA polymerase sigma-70 factor (ECF subfamily)